MRCLDVTMCHSSTPDTFSWPYGCFLTVFWPTQQHHIFLWHGPEWIVVLWSSLSSSTYLNTVFFVSFKCCLTHQNALFTLLLSSHPALGSLHIGVTGIICPTLFHDDSLYLCCPSFSNNLSISWFDHPHFTCCFIGFRSLIGMKN